MKKDTLHKHNKLANKIMFYIYKHIDTDINLDWLCEDLEISKFHMHRIFKEAFGRNIYESIKAIRLQKASNLLITNQHSTVSEIAKQCGYSSHSSFIRAFKERFDTTPKEWKKGEYKKYSAKIIAESQHPILNSTADFSEVVPEVVHVPPITAYYIRNQGYTKSIKQTWQKLQTWILSNDIKDYQQIALYHDNPSITPHDECQYIACIKTDKEGLENGRLPSFTIFGGTYAKFDVQGVQGDLLKLITWIYLEWLPQSGYETTTRPSYAIHKKNHFLSKDGEFDISFYVSIQY